MGNAHGLVVASLLVAGAGMLSCSLLLDTDALQKGTGQGAAVDAGGDGSAESGGGEPGGAAGSEAGGVGGSATGGAAGGDAGSAELPIGDLGQALAHAICANLEACGGPLAEFVYHEESCDDYLAAVLDDTIVGAIRRSVDLGKLTYDAAKAATCVQHLLEGGTQSPPRCADLAKGLEECRDALGGRSGPGEACTSYYDCESGHYCDVETSCPGACRAFVQFGGSCTKSEQCGPDLTCVKGSGGDGTCQSYTPSHGDCGDTKPPCVPGDYCFGKKCLPVRDAFTVKSGFACYTNGLLCENGLSCMFDGLPFLSTATCMEPKEAGEACNVGVPEVCATGLYCSYGSVNPKCLALPTENQACAKATVQTFGISPPCAAGLACVNDVCLPRRRLAEACSDDAQCYSGYCAGADEGTGQCELRACL